MAELRGLVPPVGGERARRDPVLLLEDAEGILELAPDSVGLPGIEVAGTRLAEHVADEDDKVLAATRRRARDATPQQACQVRLAGPEPRWVEVRFLGGLVPDRTLVLVHDVGSERRLAAEAAMLRRVTELANAGSDLHDVVQRAVRDLRVTLGWDAGHVLVVDGGALVEGGGWDVAGHATDLPPLLAADVERGSEVARAAVQRHEPVTCDDVPGAGGRDLLETVGIRATIAIPVIADGEVVRVLELFSAVPVRLDDDQRSLLSAVGIQLGSVAVRQQGVEALEATRREFERSNAELERFAYVASHDLQEPLRKIVGFSELLQLHEGPWGPEQAEYLEFVVASAQRLQRLIKDLLAYSRAGRRELRDEAVDLDAVVRDAIADLGLAIEEAGATVEVEPLPQVRGDDGQLREVLQNLLGNALKYRAEDRVPMVRVTGDVEGGVARVVVADNGIGIDPDHRTTVFEVFRRLHPAHRYGGTGLGLALVQRIVERHGGQVEIHDSPLGSGVAVHLLLPTDQEQHP